MNNINDDIQSQLNPALKPKLRQVTLSRKNKKLGEDYTYHIKAALFPDPRPINLPNAGEIQAVIRW